MREQVKNTIIKHKMFAPGDSVIVGLSGGADSVALLHLLLELREELKLGEITAVHINHNLRGKASASDEKFISELCASLNITLITYQADVKALSAEKKLGIEESGRTLRYAFMEGAVLALRAQKIAVGHNQDDNTETVLMNLCRGSGLKGLCGIPPINGIITRPLIETPRAEIEKYLTKTPYITDSSNASDEYTRNRVRNKIIPALETHINPSASAVIARNAAWLKADEDYLESVAEEFFVFFVKTGKVTLSIDAKKLVILPESIARRVVRRAISQVKVGGSDKHHLTDITAAHIMAVLSLAWGHSGREIHIPGLVVKKEYDTLIFAPPQDFHQGFSYPLQPNTPVYIPELQKTITLSFQQPTPEASNPHCTKAFIYDKVDKTCSQICVRTRRPGDTITFEGKNRRFTKKLQDYFTDAKIPASQRNHIPLLAIGSEILWIIGQDRINAKYKPDANEGKIFWISLWEKNESIFDVKGTF